MQTNSDASMQSMGQSTMGQSIKPSEPSKPNEPSMFRDIANSSISNTTSQPNTSNTIDEEIVEIISLLLKHDSNLGVLRTYLEAMKPNKYTCLAVFSKFRHFRDEKSVIQVYYLNYYNEKFQIGEPDSAKFRLVEKDAQIKALAN